MSAASLSVTRHRRRAARSVSYATSSFARRPHRGGALAHTGQREDSTTRHSLWEGEAAQGETFHRPYVPSAPWYALGEEMRRWGAVLSVLLVSPFTRRECSGH